MGNSKIIEYGNPILRKKAKPVKRITKEIKNFIDEMAKTMYNASGVGLAAIQLGIPQRIITADAGEGLIVLINPKITYKNGLMEVVEGCLSFPGLYGVVKRASEVRVRGKDRAGKMVEIEGKELLAQILQHEIDHLDGILFIDRAEPKSLYFAEPTSEEMRETQARLQAKLGLEIPQKRSTVEKSISGETKKEEG